MGDLTFKCPSCHQSFGVDAANAGKYFQCPGCKAFIIVPNLPSNEHKPAQPRARDSDRPCKGTDDTSQPFNQELSRDPSSKIRFPFFAVGGIFLLIVCIVSIVTFLHGGTVDAAFRDAMAGDATESNLDVCIGRLESVLAHYPQARQAATAMSKLSELREVKRRQEEAKEIREAKLRQEEANKAFTTGLAYSRGDGVAKNDGIAFEWFRKGAELGDARAMTLLALAYVKGEGVAKDKAKAVEWFRRGADLGIPEAMCGLGSMYANGDGVSRDDGVAFEWYQKGADLGNAQAMLALGLAYDNGNGVGSLK